MLNMQKSKLKAHESIMREEESGRPKKIIKDSKLYSNAYF